MSVRFSGTLNDKLTVTTGLPGSFVSFTMAACLRIEGPATASLKGLFALGNTTPTPDAGWFLCISEVDGRTLKLVRFDNFSVPLTMASALLVDRWYFVGLSIAGTGTDQIVLYTQDLETGAEVTTLATSATVMDGSPVIAGLGTTIYGEALKGRLAAARMWDVALTAAQMAQCARTSRAAVQAGACVNDLPMRDPTLANNYIARSGSNWTPNGTLSVEAGPPIAWGGERQSMLLGVG